MISFVFVPEKGHLRHLRRNLCGDLLGQLFRDTVRDGVGVASGHALHYVGGPQTKCLCELPQGSMSCPGDRSVGRGGVCPALTPVVHTSRPSAPVNPVIFVSKSCGQITCVLAAMLTCAHNYVDSGFMLPLSSPATPLNKGKRDRRKERERGMNERGEKVS